MVREEREEGDEDDRQREREEERQGKQVFFSQINAMVALGAQREYTAKKNRDKACHESDCKKYEGSFFERLSSI